MKHYTEKVVLEETYKKLTPSLEELNEKSLVLVDRMKNTEPAWMIPMRTVD